MSLRARQCELKDAKAFIGTEHRHNRRVVGHRFSVACEDENGKLVGVEALDQDRDDLLAEWGVVLDFVFPHREPEDQYNGRDVVDAIQEMIEEAR